MGKEKRAPKVSIIVLAYNHLPYTMQCVESVLRYTATVDYELITVDNGSHDGTKEYFESLPHEKKINFPENVGVCKALNTGFRAAKGKYTMYLSNDTVVTARWLENLLACMESDPKIGMVVPVCDASCNYQQIGTPFQDLDRMQEFAQKYNVSNPGLWDERLKLLIYAALFRTDLLQKIGGLDEDFNPGGYDDDAACFCIRRMGSRVILARDTFIHHYGNLTFRDEVEKDSSLYLRNRGIFFQKFQADPYLAGLIDFEVVRLPKYSGRDHLRILGIGSSYGGTILQVKNVCRENGSKDVFLYYLSEIGWNLRDLHTICTECALGDDPLAFSGEGRYDCIVVEKDSTRIADPDRYFTDLYGLLKPDGQLICTAANSDLLFRIMGTLYRCGSQLQNHCGPYYYLCFFKPES